MTLWRQAREVARIDLLVERRVGDTFRIVLPFAVVAMMIFSIAMPATVIDVGEVGPGVFWAVAALYGTQVALRASISETPQRRDTTILLGLDPAARFLGRSIAAALLLVGFLVVLLGAMVLLFDTAFPAGSAAGLVPAILLAAAGLGMLSTLAGEVAGGLRNRSALASLIVAPLLVPLVIGASRVPEAMARGDGILIWILLLITTDLTLLVAGVGLSRPLEEASR